MLFFWSVVFFLVAPLPPVLGKYGAQPKTAVCSVVGALAGGGLGATESAAGLAVNAAIGALFGGLICYIQDGDEDADAFT